MAFPVTTKPLLKTSPDVNMLFAPSGCTPCPALSAGCTHPPPPVPPFLLMQSLSTKDIAGSDIMKLKVS